MYEPKDKEPLGVIPKNTIPYWKNHPAAQCVLKVNSLPKIEKPYKLQLFFFEQIAIMEEDDSEFSEDVNFVECEYIFV